MRSLPASSLRTPSTRQSDDANGARRSHSFGSAIRRLARLGAKTSFSCLHRTGQAPLGRIRQRCRSLHWGRLSCPQPRSCGNARRPAVHHGPGFSGQIACAKNPRLQSSSSLLLASPAPWADTEAKKGPVDQCQWNGGLVSYHSVCAGIARWSPPTGVRKIVSRSLTTCGR